MQLEVPFFLAGRAAARGGLPRALRPRAVRRPTRGDRTGLAGADGGGRWPGVAAGARRTPRGRLRRLRPRRAARGLVLRADAKQPPSIIEVNTWPDVEYGAIEEP